MADVPLTSPGDLPRATAAQVVGRLEAELAHAPGSILASDADGTIWDGDVGFDLFEALLARRGVRAAAGDALAAEARAIGAPSAGDPTTIAETLYAAYKAERYPHDRAFAMMAWAFAGYRDDELRDFADRVLDAGRIEERVRPSIRVILGWAAERGVEVFVVSASPRAIVEAGAARLGIAADHVAAMTPALADDGVLLPELSGPVVYGEGKLHALARSRAGARGAILGAFGDSAYDAPMLRAARVPVAVTPAASLLALGATIAGLVVLDR